MPNFAPINPTGLVPGESICIKEITRDKNSLDICVNEEF